MDPVSALGAAAAVVQFTDFTGRLLSRTWKIYHSPTGQTSEDFQLTVVANDLNTLTSALVSHLEVGSLGCNDGADAQLLQLCRECSSISVELQDTLEAAARRQKNLRIQTGSRKHAGDVFREAISALWNEEKVENARKTLELVHRRMLDTVTTSIWIDSRKTKGWEFEFAKKLDYATRMLESAITTIEKSGPEEETPDPKGMMPLASQISDTVRGKHMHIDMMQLIWDPEWTPDNKLLAEFPENTGTTPEQTGITIARTLQYETMKRREQAIAPTYESTYDWVFQRRPRELDGVPLWSSVPDWLEAEASGIYWITGKPGSGKSTMMRFMMRDSRLDEYLRIWSARTSLFVGHYYAWSLGDHLDKSGTGLMRSLLHQMTCADPNLASVLFPRRWALFHATRDPSRFPEWSEWELEESFAALLRHARNNMRIILFVDGLDEFHTPPMEIITLIRRIAAEPNIKICAASRPWPEFHDAFLDCPSIQMNLLTYKDIQMYTSLQFSKSRGFLEMKEIYPDEAKSIVNEIVTKSTGVFLWTAIVTTNLLASLGEGSNLQQLRIILDKLPYDIEKLYSAILATIPPRLLPEMSAMLLIFKAACHPLPWFTMWLADEYRGANLSPDPAVVLIKSRKSALSSLKRRLAARSRGLLDLELLIPHGGSYTICYLHRTVAEWLERPGVWELISSNMPPDFDPYACLFLAEMLLMGSSTHPLFYQRPEFWKGTARSLFYASLIQCPSATLSESQFVAAMDTFNIRAQRAFKALPGNDQYMNDNPWARAEKSTGPSKEEPNNFLGLAAQFCLAPYVRAKVTERSSEFKALQSANTCGLLRQVILGPESFFRANTLQGMDLNAIQVDHRVELVKFLIQHKVQSTPNLQQEISSSLEGKEDKFMQDITFLMESVPTKKRKLSGGKLLRWMSSKGR